MGKELNMHINRETGKPKISFANFQVAYDHIKDQGLEGVIPYKCPICGLYHIGHVPQGKSCVRKLVEENNIKDNILRLQIKDLREKIRVLEKENAELKRKLNGENQASDLEAFFG